MKNAFHLTGKKKVFVLACYSGFCMTLGSNISLAKSNQDALSLAVGSATVGSTTVGSVSVGTVSLGAQCQIQQLQKIIPEVSKTNLVNKAKKVQIAQSQSGMIENNRLSGPQGQGGGILPPDPDAPPIPPSGMTLKYNGQLAKLK